MMRSQVPAALLIGVLLLTSGCGDDSGASSSTTTAAIATATTVPVSTTTTAPTTPTVPETWCISVDGIELEPETVVRRAAFDHDDPDAPAGGSVLLVGEEAVELVGPTLGVDDVRVDWLRLPSTTSSGSSTPDPPGWHFQLTGSATVRLSVEATKPPWHLAPVDATWCFDGTDLTSSVTLYHVFQLEESLEVIVKAIVDDVEVAATDPVRVETRVSGTPVTTTTRPPTSAASLVELGPWDPILSTQRARPTPAAATCSGASAGSADERPAPFAVNGVAFDTRWGKVIAGGGTWAFDVCTETWSPIGLNGPPDPGFGSPDLAYDADSDVMLVFEFGTIEAYDRSIDDWTSKPIPRPPAADGGDVGFGEAVYDPVSGLVLATDDEGGDRGYREILLAIDYDAGSITVVGTIPVETTCCQLELLGYVDEIDRLLFATGPDTFALVDPRTGETTLDVPALPWISSGRAGETVYVTVEADSPMKRICRLNTDPLAWECFDHATGSPDDHVTFRAIVGDPIHDRVLLIHSIPVVPGVQWPEEGGLDDIWALDIDTGEWTQILAPSGTP